MYGRVGPGDPYQLNSDKNSKQLKQINNKQTNFHFYLCNFLKESIWNGITLLKASVRNVLMEPEARLTSNRNANLKTPVTAVMD